MLEMSVELDKQYNKALFLIFITFNQQIFSISFAGTFDLVPALHHFKASVLLTCISEFGTGTPTLPLFLPAKPFGTIVATGDVSVSP